MDNGLGDLKVATANNDGTCYTSAPNCCGTDSFTYHADDGLLASNVATVTLNVSCVNDAPMAVNDSYTLNENTTQSGNVISDDTGNGADSDIENDTLTASLHTDVSHGTLSLAANGAFVYTPTLGFNGSDSFTYILSDGVLTDTAQVSLTIVPDLNLTTTDPSHQALNVSASQVISLSFGATVNPATVSSQTIGLYGTMGGYSWD
ncbi:MAG: Ig-like domain-containing protein [Caldilineaceae bacterium]